MKRPFLVIGITFAVGIWASFLWTNMPLLLCSVVLTVVGLVVYRLRPNARAISIICLCAALALIHASLYRQRHISPLEQLAGKTAMIQGMVTESEIMGRGFAITVRATFPDQKLPDATLRLRGYGEMEYLPGDGVSSLIRLEPLTGSGSYYRSRGIFTGARIVEIAPHTRLTLPQSAQRLVLRLRQRMIDRLYDNLNPKTAGVVSAMALGEWGGVDRKDNDALTKAGTVHLLSVSGLHLSIVVGCITALLERLRLSRRAVALGGIGASLAFALLVGLSPSITRALVMMLLMLLARLISRHSDSLNSMGLALVLIALFAPHWTLGRGLWLSCSSTAGIIVLAKPLQQQLEAFWLNRFSRINKPTGYLISAAAVSTGAYCFSFPLLLVMTGWVSLLTPLANVLVAPLAAPALICGMLCALFSPFPPAALITDFCVGLILSISRLVAGVPLLTFSLGEFWKLLWLGLAAAAVVILLRHRRDHALLRYGAALLTLAFAIGSLTLSIPRRSQAELIALEGCAPLVLIRDNSAVVVGTPSPYEINTLARYLKFREIQTLDTVIASDCGEQIGSGLLTLAADFSPGLVAGPNDDYILAQLERALPDIPVVSSGYARTQVLGGVLIAVHPITGEIQIDAGNYFVVKSNEKYAIIAKESPAYQNALTAEAASASSLWASYQQETQKALAAWQEGTPIGTRSAPAAFEPVGDFLFQERRLILKGINREQ